MPSQVAHDAVTYGIAVGASALEYGKGKPLLRRFVSVVEAPSHAVLASKVLFPGFPTRPCAAQQPVLTEGYKTHNPL